MSKLTEESKLVLKSGPLGSALSSPRRSKNTQRNVFNESSDDEFDDTEIENRIDTPKTLRRDISNNTYDLSSNISRQKLQTVTTTIPLKDEAPGSRDVAPSTPSKQLLDKINRYRSRNGTPLKQSPIVSSPKYSAEETDPEAEIIRNLKLINDHNKFVPDYQSHGSNVTMSPPSNLKIRPLKFGNTSEKDDIEFDPSDLENTTPKKALNILPSELLKPMVASDVFSAQKPNDKVRTALFSPKVSNGKLSSDVFNPEVTPLRSTSESIVTNVKSNPQEILENDRIDEDEIDIDRLTETVRSEGLTKEEIMEQINSSVNLLKEKDIFRTKPDEIPQFNDNEILASNDEEASSDDEILQELDSHLPRSELLPSDRSGIRGFAKEISDDELERRKPISKISSPVKILEAPETKRESNSLSGQYARHLMRKRREKVKTKIQTTLQSGDNTSLNVHVSNTEHSITPEEYSEWPSQKWRKLQKLLDLPTLTEDIIINSDLVLNNLKCSSKQELKDRVQYLQEYRRVKAKRVKSKSKPYRVTKKSRK